MRRLLRIIFGFTAAMLAAAASEVMFALPPFDLIAMDAAARGDRAAEMGALTLRAATHSAIFCAGFALIAILVAELLRLRDWTYYVVVGIVIALGGFLAQYASENASHPTIANNYALIAFVISGTVGGLVYWLAAGHNAGRRRPAARIKSADELPPGTWTRGEGDGDHNEPVNERRVQSNTADFGDGQDVPEEGQAEGTQSDKEAACQGADGDAAATRPMTSVPAVDPKIAVRPRLSATGSVPDSGQPKLGKG